MQRLEAKICAIKFKNCDPDISNPLQYICTKFKRYMPLHLDINSHSLLKEKILIDCFIIRWRNSLKMLQNKILYLDILVFII